MYANFIGHIDFETECVCTQSLIINKNIFYIRQENAHV